MNALLDPFIEALRNELQQLGEMLALLEQQHQHAVRPTTSTIQSALSLIQAQRANMQRARAHRQTIQRRLADHLGLVPTASFAELRPRLPEAYQPLVTALVQENVELLGHIEQRAHQHQVLLKRSLERLGEFVATLPCSPSQSPSPAVPPASDSNRSGSLVQDAPVNPWN